MTEARAGLEEALATWASIEGRYPYPMQWIARLPLIALDAHEGRTESLAEHTGALLGAVQILLPESLMDAIAEAHENPVLANARVIVERACAAGFL